jgi:uracil-DNA glycosylase
MPSTSPPPPDAARAAADLGEASADGGDDTVDGRDALLALAGELRAALGRHARAGRWAASAAPSPRLSAARLAELDLASSGAGAPAEARAASSALPGSDVGVAGAPDEDDAPGAAPRPRRTLATVRAELGDCQRCKLAATRTKLVFGTGAQDAALVFVGEAPGADEDRTGEPFVGRAGELLDKMIEAMGWSRRSVYIANLLKCRPPNNRNPEADEARECRPFLIAQLEVIAPRIVVALGRPAANALLSSDAPIGALRGQFHERLGVKIMPTFHPAYLLREPGRKRDAWADLKMVMAELERIGVSPTR